ncbi:protein-disulfide reductase DsbD N-terminal domain-containing protein [Mucilaginibacter sp. SMC90]|uniref:protein-disulfide reductase DsbD domain-containing protein n=1 Tax=Mucilaginibacter sp. SMC90 TaxID=2929803 RepID=UPI001FB2C824|nr:protein-disulfide reductase DsbD domain-containing protein [Mucilaginibacter sp. SMC90]UOE46584.1 protein-disulfide reductase DsbD N-terminal domain-containing protein [Mucilaginibacter sp. SMC90]
MKKLILAALTFFISTASYAQIITPVKWAYGTKKINNKQAVVFITATIDNGWHIYSQHVADGGPAKTSFRFDKSDNYTLNGSTTEPKAISKYEGVFGMNVQYFVRSVLFQQKIKLKNGQALVKGTLSYMACNDHECLPPEAVDFRIPIK